MITRSRPSHHRVITESSPSDLRTRSISGGAAALEGNHRKSNLFPSIGERRVRRCMWKRSVRGSKNSQCFETFCGPSAFYRATELNWRIDMTARTFAERGQSGTALQGACRNSGSPSPMVRLTGATCPAPRCPHCDSIVYSRKNKLCGVCSRQLPDSFLFSEAEATRVARILAIEKERHRKWISKAFLDAVSVL